MMPEASSAEGMRIRDSIFPRNGPLDDCDLASMSGGCYSLRGVEAQLFSL